MPTSRRAFLATAGAAAATSLAHAPLAHAVPWLAARGREGTRGGRDLTSRGSEALILLNSNENPYGPAPEAVNAMLQVVASANRYPDSPEDALRDAIAAHHGVARECVLIGCGSTEILAVVTDAFTAPNRRLLTVAPTFETPRDVATRKHVPIETIEVDGSLRIDLQAMYEQCRGAGLLFICNPNNPTGTLHGIFDLLHFVAQVNTRSPETHVLIDEAYFDYVDDRDYGSAIPEAVKNPRLIVSRTFSKIHGMAGLRAGYAIAHPDTVRLLDAYRTPSGVNLLAATAAIASLSLPEHRSAQRARNAEVRTFAMDAMQKMGFAVVPSQANFFLTDIRRDPAAFQRAMRGRGIAVGRPFPPFKTHTRISIGTMDEMQQAMAVAADVLGRA